ncbi:MAG: ABC transporter substrate-binding protein [Syntrophales bacterium]|nr:ABC transporter substrate-binding protein [Syntrophales bacterium]
MKRIVSKVMVVIACVILIWGATIPAQSAEPVTGKLMIYTSIYLHIIEQLKPVLKAKFPNLEVQWFYGGSEKVITKLVAEFEQGNTMADLIMIADPAYYNSLKREGRLLKYKSPNFRYLHAGWFDKDGYYSGVRTNVMGIAYNRKQVAPKDLPKTWWDLANPKWKGRVGMPNPLLSGTAFVSVAGLARSPKHGWPLFEAYRKNRITCEPGNGAVETKLLSGQLAVGMLLEENVLKAMNEGKPLGFVYPQDGPVVIPAPIAIMKTTRNQAAAKAVYDFFLSKEGQKAIIDGWMPSVRKDMPAPKNAALHIKDVIKFSMPMDWEAISREPEKVKEKFDKIVLH